MTEARLNIVKTRNIKRPTYYVTAIQTEYSQYAFDEDRAVNYRGEWREKVFEVKDPAAPMDLEIGTGNGYFFAHRAATEPTRSLVGVELKFKPLIQSIRRTLKAGATNARIVRYHAHFLENLFVPGEIDNVFIHHPDPWTKRSTQKNRLLKAAYLSKLFELQRPGSFLEFKTDSRDYFMWAVEELKKTPYIVERYSEDLHRSEWSHENFITQFERIFTAQGHSIYYLRAKR